MSQNRSCYDNVRQHVGNETKLCTENKTKNKSDDKNNKMRLSFFRIITRFIVELYSLADRGVPSQEIMNLWSRESSSSVNSYDFPKSIPHGLRISWLNSFILCGYYFYTRFSVCVCVFFFYFICLFLLVRRSPIGR